MADKKLKRPDFILQKDFFVKNDANEQETGPKKQKQKSSKRNQETEASCKENKKNIKRNITAHICCILTDLFKQVYKKTAFIQTHISE